MSKSTITEGFYVYVLFRPWDGSPFYVGKGKGRRWLDHDREYTKNRNVHLSNIFRKAAVLGLEIPRVKVKQGLSESDAFMVEKSFIAAIGRKRSGGPLVNATDGGDGMSGLPGVWAGKKFTEEHRSNIAKGLAGHRHSGESKGKMRDAWKRRSPVSVSTKKKMSESAKAKPAIRSDTREKISAKAKQFSNSPQGKALRSLAASARWNRLKLEKEPPHS